jgi:hypothetical protein
MTPRWDATFAGFRLSVVRGAMAIRVRDRRGLVLLAHLLLRVTELAGSARPTGDAGEIASWYYRSEPVARVGTAQA